jgi:hypothetical protein
MTGALATFKCPVHEYWVRVDFNSLKGPKKKLQRGCPQCNLAFESAIAYYKNLVFLQENGQRQVLLNRIAHKG